MMMMQRHVSLQTDNGQRYEVDSLKDSLVNILDCNLIQLHQRQRDVLQ